MLPEGLADSIEQILHYHAEGQLSAQALLYFISEIQAAIVERTAGLASTRSSGCRRRCTNPAAASGW
jgi:hypothetical protein